MSTTKPDQSSLPSTRATPAPAMAAGVPISTVPAQECGEVVHPKEPTQDSVHSLTGNERPDLVPTDTVTVLDERRRAARTKFAVRPLTQHELLVSADIVWAQQDPEIQLTHKGEFVVPYRGQIVAHGQVAAQVLEEAARKTGIRTEELPLVGIIDPVADIPH